MDVSKAQIAGQLYNRLPRLIQERIFDDRAFVTRYGSFARTYIAIGGDVTVEQQELFTAVRRAFAGNDNQSVRDINGQQVLVTVGHESVSLKVMVEQELRTLANIRDLLILSADREDRTRALNRLIDRLGPTAPDYAALQRAAEERELTDEETAILLDEVRVGHEAYRERITAAHYAQSIRLDDIVPNSLSYYERFCGPVPRDISPEDYLTKVLPSHRKTVLSRDLQRGLEICLLGALRDDLKPSAWTQSVSDNDMWNALEACNSLDDPVSLLGALDIAINRLHDERYRSFADKTVSKLTQDQLLRPDGIDYYELLPLFARLVLNRISMLEGGALLAPYWKRMCAWMQAGLVLRITRSIKMGSAPLLRTPD